MPTANPIRVCMAPDYTDANPYQAGLISGLEHAGIEVNTVDVGGLLPLLSSWYEHDRPSVIHLHWIHRFIDTDRRGGTVLAMGLMCRTIVEIIILRTLGISVVWTVHNLVSHERRYPRIELAFRMVVARLVNRLIVHCDDAENEIISRYRLSNRSASRISTIPHGNYDPFYSRNLDQPEAREKLDLPQDVPIFLFFGMIRAYKCVPDLIRTFRSLPENRAHLLVVGNPWSQEIRATVTKAAGSDPSVHTVLEYVEDEAIEAYLTAADALVLPYDGILTSGSAILGMTFSRAVIAPQRGCLNSLLGGSGGLTYDPNEDNALSKSLEVGINNQERLRSVGARNRRVADKLSWHVIGEKTAELYESTRH